MAQTLTERYKALSEESTSDDIEDTPPDGEWEPVPKEFYDDQELKRIDAMATAKWKADIAKNKRRIARIGRIAYKLATNDDFRRSYSRLSRNDRKAVKWLVDDAKGKTTEIWHDKVLAGDSEPEDVFAACAKEAGKPLDNAKNSAIAVIYGMGFDD